MKAEKFVLPLTRQFVHVLTLVAMLLPVSALAATFYVAPAGKDTNPGTEGSPFATMAKAQSAATAGDTVYLRGGTYKLDNSNITRTERNYAYVNYLDKKSVSYLAYKDEIPVFDFSGVKPDNLRMCAFLVSGGNIHLEGFEVTGVQVTIPVAHTQSEYFRIESSNNILRRVKMHDGMGIGVYIIRASANNLIENCDAYNNTGLDRGSIGNIDGFGCHVTRGGTGNVFRGDRAWANSDDGYDTIHCAESVTFDHCWAMDNGWQGGDGNGFKSGGWNAVAVPNLPDPMPRHNITFCLSVHNKANGFYANHQPGGSANWFNNSSYNNRNNFNMLEREDDNVTDRPGIDEVLHNNVAFKATGQDVASLNETGEKVSHNSWTLDITVKDSDFVSLDASQLTQPRPADGSMPKITFMHLAPGSSLIGKGMNVGLPFTGTAPDLGCFAFTPATASKTDTAAKESSTTSAEAKPATPNK